MLNAFMRTTVDVPDSLFRQMKALAALRGQSLKEFFLRAIQRELLRETGKKQRTDKLPLIRSRKPGSLRLSNAEIEDYLAGH